MLENRNKLENCLRKEFQKIIFNQNFCKEIYDQIKEDYDIPRTLSSDLITYRKELTETSEFVLFCILDTLFKKIKTNKLDPNNFFTEQEVKTYRNSKYHIKETNFPLSFKMIEVSHDQWVGTITIKELMELRKAQLINYNTNAQRTMQKIIKGDKEFYKISLNWNAVNQIQQSYQENSFIPNTITLNIPDDVENNFYYNNEENTLIIKQLKTFDITDGYHRYIAACQCSDQNPDFDYSMELRIINFSEDKARQFIYQEDQKTKMKRIDANSLNMHNSGNLVVERVNENSSCNLQGLITRNQGIINFGLLANMVNYFYFKNYMNKEDTKIQIINVSKKIVKDLNILTEYDTNYLKKEFDFQFLLSFMYCFNIYKDKESDYICKITELVYRKIKESDNNKFKRNVINKPVVNEVEKIAKECEEYVV